MIIPIEAGWRLASDEHTWMIQRLQLRKSGKDAGTEKWNNVRYYATVQQAVNGYFQLRLRTDEAKTLTEALAASERIVASLVQALTPQFEIKCRGNDQ